MDGTSSEQPTLAVIGIVGDHFAANSLRGPRDQPPTLLT
jgi:hypothetical protein